jgi:hypothetical protein
MDFADAVNGLFELCGAVALWQNVRAIRRDKTIAGVHWGATAFFTTGGLWNLYYYPSLDQWASFAGGLAIAGVNLVWLGYVWKYRRNI